MVTRHVLVLGLAATLACGDAGDAPLGAPDGGPPGDGGAPTAKPSLALSPRWWEHWLFGPTLVGQTAKAEATLTAHQDVTGIVVSVTRAGYTLTNLCPDRLTAGESCRIELGFAPLAQGSYSGDRNLVVSWTDAGGDRELAMGLGGIGILAAARPGLAIPVAELTFPPTVIGGSSTRQIAVVNTGHLRAVPGLAVDATTPELELQLDPACRQGIAPGESCAIEARYTPTDWGCDVAFVRLEAYGPATYVRACAARSEERGRARLDGVGRLVRERDGFLFTHERANIHPGPGPSRATLHRLLADGRFDAGYGDRGRLRFGTGNYVEQGLRDLGAGRMLWFGLRQDRGGSDLALVEDGLPGDVVSTSCRVVDATATDAGAIGLLCDEAGREVAMIQRHPDLSEDVGFGRVVLFEVEERVDLFPHRLRFDAARQRFVASSVVWPWSASTISVRLVSAGAGGEPGFSYELPFGYDDSETVDLLLGSDGSPYVVGAIRNGSQRALNVAKLAEHGGLDPQFAGGSVSLPVEAPQYVGGAGLVALTPEAPTEIAFLHQFHLFPGGPWQGASWDAIECRADGECRRTPRIAVSKEAGGPISLADGERWLTSGWGGGTTFEWTYSSVRIAALRADGSLDPSFANDGDVTDERPGGVAPWRLGADANGYVYLAAHDVVGQHRQPRVTRYDQAGVRTPGFDFALPRRRPESTFFWESVAWAGGEPLYGRNLDLLVAPDGSGLLASFEGNPARLWLSAFTPGGALDPSFGDGGQVALDLLLDEDGVRWGPFGVSLAKLPDGTYWVAINSNQGRLRRVAACGAPLGPWLEPAKGRIGALVVSGNDLLAFGDGGGVRVSPEGTISPTGGWASPNAAIALLPDGGYVIATPCVARYTADGQPADGLGRPVFGDRGSLCFDHATGVARTILVGDDGTLDVYGSGWRTRLSADGQVLGQIGFDEVMVRDALPTSTGALLVGRDRSRRLILTQSQ